MTIKMNSLSSGLMLGVALYRNQPGVFNKVMAQPAYALITVISAIETVATLAFSALSLVILPFSSAPLTHSINWLGSSIFCFGWSIAALGLNFFVGMLIADERGAREILESGNLLSVPRGGLTEIKDDRPPLYRR